MSDASQQAEQLELFTNVQRTEPFRRLCCHKCGRVWLTPDLAPSGATFAICPDCSAVVAR